MRRSLVGGIAVGLVSCLVAAGLSVSVPAVALVPAQSGGAELVADPVALVPAQSGPAELAGDPVASEREPVLDAGPAPDAATAMEAARLHDSPVEDLSQRTESSQTFARPDGTWITEITSGPVRVEAADGSWSAIDTTLVQSKSGVWVPRAAVVDLVFSDGGTGPFVSMGLASGKSFGLGWPSALPEPVVDGSTLTYREVVPGGDLVVQALPEGFSHSVVLHVAPEKPLDLRFPLTLDGVSLTERADGSLSVQGSGGKELAGSPAPLMWDAAKDATGSPENVSEFATRVDTGIATPALVLTPDAAVLRDPETVYPVTIDPTFTTSAYSDTWVQNIDFTTGQGSSTELRAGSHDGGVTKARSFMMFHSVFLEGKQILDADLKLRNWRSASCAAGAIRVSKINEAWPQPITWTNQPEVGVIGDVEFSPAYGDPDGSCSAAKDAVWNVTPIVQGWAATDPEGFPNYGLRVRAVDETSTNTWRRYRSRNFSDTALHPRLVVVHNNVPGVPGSLAVAPCVGACSPVVTDSTTPTLSAKATDDDGGQLTYSFQVRKVGTTAVVASGSPAPVTQNVTASWPVPSAQALQDLTGYEFRVSAADGNATTWSGWKAFTVDVDQPPTTPTGLRVAPCLGGCSPMVTDTLDPELSAVATDPDTATLDHDFEVRESGTTQVLADGSVSAGQGTTATWSVTPGTLVDQLTYEFRVAGRDSKTTTWSGWQPFSVDLVVPPAADEPSASDPGDVSTLCASGSASGLSTEHGYVGAYVPPGATAHFVASGTVNPRPYFAGYWVAQGYLHLDATNGAAVSVHSSTKLIDYYDNPLPPSIPFTKDMGSWTNTTGSDEPILLDMWAQEAGLGWAGISWSVQVTISGGAPGTCMPLEQTFGGGCNCLGVPTSYQHLSARPVNTATGSLYESFTDVSLPGPGRQFAFTRSYNSLDTSTGPMGPGWTFGFNASLTVDAGTGDVMVRAADGQQAVYRSVSGAYEAPPGVQSVLVALSGGGFRLTRPDQSTLEFDDVGRLVAVEDHLGVGLTLAYSDGKLASITDAAGREVEVTFTGARLTRLDLPDGRHVDYGYTGGRLTSATDMRGKTTTYGYTGGRLASAVDPDGNYLFQNSYDAGTGRVTSQLDPRGKQTTFGWNPSTRTATLTDPRGKVWSYTYRRNVLLSSSDPLGNTTQYGYDDRLNRTSVTDPRGKVTTFAYDPAGNMTLRSGPAPSSVQELWTYTSFNAVETYTNGRGKTTNYEYYSNQLLKKKIDPLARETTYTWTANGLPDAVTDPRGEVVDFGYDAAGNLTSMLSPEGNLTTFGFDASGRRTSMVEARGNVSGANPNDFTTTWEYNANDQVTKVTDPLGRGTTSSYDDAGNLVSVTDADSASTSYEYNADNQVAKVTDPRGGETTTTYDDNGNVASVTTPAGTTTFGYDDANRQVSEVTPRGNVSGATAANFTWTTTHDANSNKLTESNPTAGTTTTAYDELNRPTTLTDAHGEVTTTAYNANGNVVSMTDPLTRVTAFSYDNADQQITMTDPSGKVTEYGHDASGNKASVKSPLGNIEKWTYDGDGRLATQIDPRGNVTDGTPSQYTTSYSHDAAGHLLSVTDPLTHARSYGYDRVGNLTTRTDARNNTTTYTYDVLNQLKTVKDPLNNTTSYDYNETGLLTGRTDANTHATAYTYDLAGRLTQKAAPAGTWKYAYDAAGNLTKIETAAGVATTGITGDGTITRTHDPLNRLTGIDYSDSTPDVTYGYDELRRTSMTDNAVAGAASETYGYDDAGQLAGVARGASGFTYTYDDNGRLTSRAVPDGRTITQTWDDDSRPTAVADGSASTSYSYDAAGNRTGTTFGNTITETRDYDRAGRLSALTTQRATTVISGHTITRDPVGNPTGIVRSYPDTQGESYTYDADNRVTGVCWSTDCIPDITAETKYTYDGVGNRLTEQRIGGSQPGTITSTYNSADQLTQTYQPPYILNPAITTTYGHDANGNQTTAGGTTFAYDLANRVKTATTGGTTTTYTHDGDATRLSSTTGANTSNLTWDKNYPLPELTAETLTGGARKYLNDPSGDPIALINPGTGNGTGTQYLHPNGINSISAVTDSTNARQATYSYDPFGLPQASPTNEDNVSNPIRFASEYLDTNSGRYHVRARDYDPATGRFNSLDPIAQDINDPYVSEYIYANNQPTVYTDPSGLCPMCLAVLGGVAIDVGIQVLGNLRTGCDPFHGINWGEAAAWGVVGAASGGLFTYLRTIGKVGQAAKGFATGADDAVFWSGVGRRGDKVAAEWAAKHGGVTLETSMAARGISLPAWDAGNPAVVAAWRDASSQFARGASGNVRVLQGDAVRLDSVWAQVEFPALKANSNVTSITAINPSTGASSVIWRR